MGADCERRGTYDPLSTATRWHYAFSYSLQVHDQHDEIRGTVRFNLVDRGLRLRAAGGRDMFDNLAQFTQVYPQVRSDLNDYLVPIDVDTTDKTQLANAQAALESAATMIDWLATSPPRFADSVHPPALTASGDGSIAFTIAEGSAQIGGVDALTVTVTLTEALPAGAGAPLVEIPGYTCERQASTDPLAGVFAYTAPDGTYLPAAAGMYIAARTFVLPDLDILERQDAKAEVYITRNADLVPGKTIADEFVYTTPTVSFDQPLHPTLVVDEAINLATIFSTGPKAPVKRPLACQLAVLYDALFAQAGTDDVTLQATLYYDYAINPGLANVRLPVYLMPPTLTKLRDGGFGTPLEDVIAMQVAGWNTWWQANAPETAAGSLALDLTVMSNLTARPMPILHLTGLYVPLVDLSAAVEAAPMSPLKI